MNHFDLVRRTLDMRRLLNDTDSLWKEESGLTCDHQRKSALLVERLMREAGLKGVERIVHPADGQTVFQDKVMPLAWRASRGKMEIVESAIPFEDPVVADFARHRFHVMKDSEGLSRRGTVTRLLGEDEILSGVDARGAMIMLNPEKRATWASFARAADAGALGIVSDNLVGRYSTPHGIQWANAFTDGPGWHKRAGGRSLAGFSVSPFIGDRLREALRAGPVKVRVSGDGRHLKGFFDTVTGLLPGREEKEVWLMAHLYEPLADDNSTGVIGALEIARTLGYLQQNGLLPEPRFTLRLVFGHEVYGFAAYAEKRGGFLGDQVLAGFNMDGLPVVRDMPARLRLSPPGSPFFGDYDLKRLAGRHGRQRGLMISELTDSGGYDDDMFLADSTTGLPSLWLSKDASREDPDAGYFWHNSCQTTSIIDRECFCRVLAFIGAWASRLTGLSEDRLPGEIERARLEAQAELFREAAKIRAGCSASGSGPLDLEFRFRRETGRLRDFARVTGDRAHLRMIESAVGSLEEAKKGLLPSEAAPAARPAPADRNRALMEKTFIRRARRGFPHDLAAVPEEDRKRLPDMVLYGPMGRILANADGRKSVADLFREARWETGGEPAWEQAGAYLGALQYLGRHGYLEIECADGVGEREIFSALEKAGIRPGDLLLVHGSLSALGHVPGGEETVIDAVLEYLGPGGTLLMPAFTRSFTHFIGLEPVRFKDFRPFNRGKGPVTTGIISEKFRRRPGVLRSVHPSHSVCGIGPLAGKCLEGHRESDPPTGPTSPFAKLLEHGGKMAWLGADLSSATFLHFLESERRLPYLLPAVCVVEEAGGRLRSLLVPGHLPGCRDFYRSSAEKSRVFSALAAEGLEIRRAPLGHGLLRVIESGELYEKGMRVLGRRPDIMLCEGRGCAFCSRWRKEL